MVRFPQNEQVKNVFDWIKRIAEDKRPWDQYTEEEHKVWNTYMVLKCFSMGEEYIELTNILHSYWNWEPERLYKCLCNLVPPGKFYFKYIKSKTPKPDNDLLEHLSKYFKLSKREVASYVPLLDKTQTKTILEELGLLDSEIKKLV